MSEHTQHQTASIRGQTLVEFSLVLTLLLMVLFGIIEFGRALYAYNALANAAREGARYGIIHPTDQSGIDAKARNAAVGLSLASVNVSFPDGQSTSGNRIRVNISHNFQADTPLFSPNFTLTSASTMTIQ
jgi:Flp pilus assembly protein TadG